MGLNAAQAEAQAKDDNERVTATHHGALRGAPGGLPERGLRRPDRPAAQAAARPRAKCATKWQKQLGHVLVDEYQDTNATQYELLKLLVGERGRFTAVGDDDQSIYGWRGATLDNLQAAAESTSRR